MDAASVAILLLIMALAAYLQTIIGFGFGLIVVSAATAFDIVPLIFSAALVSFTSFFQMLVAITGDWKKVNWRPVKPVVVGLIPGVVLGVYLLELLSEHSVNALRSILGFVVLVAAVVSLVNFRHYRSEPARTRSILFGALGGISGGMFSNSAAPIVYHLHKQRLPFAQIRTAFFIIFLVSTSTRIAVISTKGHVTHDLIVMIAWAVPAIAVATIVARKYPAPFSTGALRRLSFALLAVLGVLLLLNV